MAYFVDDKGGRECSWIVVDKHCFHLCRSVGDTLGCTIACKGRISSAISSRSLIAVADSAAKTVTLHSVVGCHLTELRLWCTQKSIVFLQFAHDSTHLLAADRSGDVYRIAVEKDDKPTLLLGHVSLLTGLTCLSVSGLNFVVTSDRDEKIRISRYPNSYEIHAYLLGHSDAVTAICPIANEGESYIVSASTDDTIRLWSVSESFAKCLCVSTRRVSVDTKNKDVSYVCKISNRSSVVAALVTANDCDRRTIVSCADLIIVYFLMSNALQVVHQLSLDATIFDCFLTEMNDRIVLHTVHDTESPSTSSFAVDQWGCQPSDCSILLPTHATDAIGMALQTPSSVADSRRRLPKKQAFDNVDDYMRRKVMRLVK